MVNKLITGFLEDEKHRNLYSDYLKNPTNINKEKVEEAFRNYAMKIKILSYFSKVFFFESQRFDKKVRAKSALPLLVDEDVDESTVNEDLIYTEDENNDNFSLEQQLEDKRLYNIITNLSADSKKLLYLLYVEDLDESQVASKLGVTKQAVNKRKNNLLKKIRKLYFN